MSIRVVIAEDEAIIRLDLKETLEEEGYDAVGETGRGDQGNEMTRELKPDLAQPASRDRGRGAAVAAAEQPSRRLVQPSWRHAAGE
mgnify:CR=1 FL=1